MRLVFVTDRKDAHAARFSELFESLGVEFHRVDVSGSADEATFEFDGDTVNGWEGLRTRLSEGPTVVVSGPLDTVSAQLVGGSFRHVGISWATDVMVTAATSPFDLRALAATLFDLDLVVLDNYATENAVIALGVKPERICRVPWGPDGSSSAPLKRSELGISEEAWVVLYPRSLEAHYQPELFIDAFERLVTNQPTAVAVLVESGSLVRSVKDDISRRGLRDNVVWLPALPPQDFPAVVAMADCLVVTTRTDGTSVTVMDAMHHGVPVVTSLTNGSAEWILHGVTGWTFPVGDSEGLALALKEVASMTASDRRVITDNARRLVEAKAGWAKSGKILESEMKKLFTF